MRISRCGLPLTRRWAYDRNESIIINNKITFVGLVSVTIIAFALVIALVVIISKQ